MASTIESVRDSLDPQTVANAIYEMMMKWHAAEMKLAGAEKGQRPVHQGKRQALEECLALFFNIPPREVRGLLRRHYRTRSGNGRNGGTVETTLDYGRLRGLDGY